MKPPAFAKFSSIFGKQVWEEEEVISHGVLTKII